MFDNLKQGIKDASNKFIDNMRLEVTNCQVKMQVKTCKDCRDFKFCRIKKFEAKK